MTYRAIWTGTTGELALSTGHLRIAILMRVKILRVISWFIIFGLVILTIVPANERPVTDLQHDVEHFLAFGLAGITFGFAYAKSLSVNFLGAIVFALALELSQVPLSTRHARVEDFVVDAFAICLGIAVAHACRYLAQRS